MQRFNASELAKIAGLLEGGALALRIDGSITKSIPAIEESLKSARRTLEDLDLTLSVLQLDRTRALLQRRGLKASELRESFIDLNSRLQDELELRCFLVLSPSKARYFDPELPLWGEGFRSNFPSASRDMEEAARCFALGLNTATAFHAMRIAEVGIRALARCLGIADPVRGADRNWAVALRKVKEEIDRRWPAAQRLAGDGHKFEALYASLDAMKNPWRNATMHVEAIYSEDDARAIFDAVGAFMRRVSDRMNEDGLPLA